MANKVYKPTSAWRRKCSTPSFEELTTGKPEKSLVEFHMRRSWRNHLWRITVRRRWWGHKRLYRKVDFDMTWMLWKEAVVKQIEYDPNRTCYIALIYYTTWDKSYIISPKWLKVWDKIVCDEKAEIKLWNRTKIRNIPVWYDIHNVEVVVWKWWQIVKAAWTSAKLVSLDTELAQVQLPSWEVRFIPKDAYASVWVVSNADHSLIRLGKAWRSRWMWIRPHVLWKSMNTKDHPHWWWEWHTPIWMKHPKTMQWMPALWHKTRKRKSITSKFIAVSRHRKK